MLSLCKADLKAQGKLRRLHIRSCQIQVAIFDIARALTLALAALVTIYTAAIRGIVPHTRKVADTMAYSANAYGRSVPMF